MIDTEAIFRYKKPNEAKLLEYGFKYDGAVFRLEIPVMRKQFMLDICISQSGAVQYKVMETELAEEYTLVNVSSAQGGFVGDVREACGKALTDVAAKCFDTEILKAEQTNRALRFISDTFDVKPEFLWKKYPGYAAFRRQDNEKWFAIIMTVDRSRLGLPGQGNAEIIDMKADPDTVEELLKRKDYYPAYHMNKKHWFTVCLDGSLTDKELFALIASSFADAA